MEVTSQGMGLCYLVLLLISLSTPRVDSQLDSGFINIDCGLAANSISQDTNTKLAYVPDDQFIDTGENHVIASQYADNLLEQYLTVRSFPNGTRNCYTLRSLTIGSKYLVRGLFKYGNYDKLNKLPTFDVHLGVNYWNTVEITSADGFFFTEIVTTITSDYLQVCLINTNQGIPFITALELRPFKTSIYKDANSTQSLVYFDRLNLGASKYLRYPADPYDRFWWSSMEKTWTNISTSSNVDPDPDFQTPSLVMQTAATTLSTAQPLYYSWTSANESTKFFIILHIGEIQDISSSARREFNIYTNGDPLFNHSSVPSKLYSGWVKYTDTGYNEYNVSLIATSNSTLPPLMNAIEVYVITPATGIPTNNEDVTTMNTIKVNYKVNKGWSGDPCSPKELSWSGVSCTSDSTKTQFRIIALNLSSSGLTGAIVPSFGNLSALQSLDLSYNDLSGDLPSFLDKLSDLKYLDITGNDNISTTLPPGLQSKKRDGNLIFRFGSATPSIGKDMKNKSPAVIIAVVVVVVLLLIAAAIIIVVCLRRRKSNQSNISKPIDSYKPNPQEYYHPPNLSNTQAANIPQDNIAVQYNANMSKPNDGRVIWDPDNRRFSYNDLVRITNQFQNNIGTGGFGSVYFGTLENGTKVAVKMRSHTSSQGMKEFLAEAQNLARVHHRYLVSLIGYCMDGDCMALVYEYMQEGTLQKKLMDTERPLSWKQRVKIAHESALGLDYLHKACNPPLIHRDVKTSNILLNENLEARIADFGLSRAFNNAASSHVSTVVVGTLGYLDPEYYSLYQLSEKSDVFSFGVVLLELITGQPPIVAGPGGSHLKEWVNQKLSRGDIENIADPRMHGQYDINSVWKVTDLARKCTGNSSSLRPTMSTVVMELKESLDLEISTERTRRGNENFSNYVSQNSAFEMPYMGDISASGPIAR